MLKRFRSVWGRCLPNINANCTNNCFQFRYTFIWGEAHPFAVFGQLGEELEGCPWWWAVVFLLSTVLSPSSGPCIPSIFGESRSWPEATFLSIFSGCSPFPRPVSFCFVYSFVSHFWASTRCYKIQLQPWTACPGQWLQFRLAGNSRPPAPEGRTVQKQSKDVWTMHLDAQGSFPRHLTHTKKKEEKSLNSKPPLPSRICCGSRCPL